MIENQKLQDFIYFSSQPQGKNNHHQSFSKLEGGTKRTNQTQTIFSLLDSRIRSRLRDMDKLKEIKKSEQP